MPPVATGLVTRNLRKPYAFNIAALVKKRDGYAYLKILPRLTRTITFQECIVYAYKLCRNILCGPTTTMISYGAAPIIVE